MLKLTLMGEGPTHEVVGRFGSLRAAEPGNRLGRSLVMKPTTRLRNGEGSTGREATDASTCSVHRGSEHGM